MMARRKQSGKVTLYSTVESGLGRIGNEEFAIYDYSTQVSRETAEFLVSTKPYKFSYTPFPIGPTTIEPSSSEISPTDVEETEE